MNYPADFWLPRQQPTMYFIGVTTAQSAIMRIFPRWSALWGLDAHLEGYDAPLHAPAATYRAIVNHIKHDPLSIGALVTTHKIDLLAVTRDLFDYLDPNAELCGEVSAIFKRDGKLHGYALDPISAGLAWRTFVPAGYFGATGAEVLCLGGGGAAIALSAYLALGTTPADRPARLLTIDNQVVRLHNLKQIHARFATTIQFHYMLNLSASENDSMLDLLPTGSVVINATGLGKDRPGSPITESGIFPLRGIVWEMNYRGWLDFLQQADRQRERRGLTITDGWNYFLHGWTLAISTIFEAPLTPALFTELDKAATAFR
ncbi:MAG: shikimate dehydrogenase [Anaerolineae bacterium]|nr:shikimate dehydrogenase [Anaerolineae bacterium]